MPKLTNYKPIGKEMEILSVRYRTFLVNAGVDASLCEMEVREELQDLFVCVTSCAGEQFLAARRSPFDSMFEGAAGETSDIGVLCEFEGREKACADRRYGKAFRKLCAVFDQIVELDMDAAGAEAVEDV